MRPSFDAKEGQRRRPALLIVSLILVLGVALGLGSYAAYRVVAFADSVFPGSERPDWVGAAAPTPEPEAAEAESPASTPTEPPAATASAAKPAPPTPVATLAPTATPIDERTIAGKLQAGRRVSFLLIGYGGPGHDGAYLTDAIVVVTFEPKSGRLALFNLPRDLWVQTPNPNGRPGPYRKINEIYSIGLGPAAFNGQPLTQADHDRAAWLAAGVAQEVLGLPIDGWVSADFDAVRRVIDGLGGVTVNVERAFDDYMYPRNDNAAIDAGVKHVHFDAGPQRMTGERALQYARSRQSAQDGGDFGRSRRQQRLLLAMKDQALTPATLPKVFTLMDAVQGHLRTSLSLAEARDVLFYGRDRNGGVQAAPSIIDTNELLSGTMSDGGASILVPKAGAGNYTAIRRFVQATLRPNDEGPARGG